MTVFFGEEASQRGDYQNNIEKDFCSRLKPHKGVTTKTNIEKDVCSRLKPHKGVTTKTILRKISVPD
jgi:hypothetical protein